jgi:hypothetical protein
MSRGKELKRSQSRALPRPRPRHVSKSPVPRAPCDVRPTSDAASQAARAPPLPLAWPLERACRSAHHPPPAPPARSPAEHRTPTSEPPLATPPPPPPPRAPTAAATKPPHVFEKGGLTRSAVLVEPCRQKKKKKTHAPTSRPAKPHNSSSALISWSIRFKFQCILLVSSKSALESEEIILSRSGGGPAAPRVVFIRAHSPFASSVSLKKKLSSKSRNRKLV